MRKVAFFLAIAFVFFLMLPLMMANDIVTAQDPTGTPDPNTPTFETGSFVRDMVFDGQFVWVANWYDNNLYRLDPATGVLIGDPVDEPALRDQNIDSLGRGTTALAFDGTFIWTASDTNNFVGVINRSGEIENSFITANARINEPVDLLFDNERIWVLNQGGSRGTLVPIIAATQTPLEPIFVGRFPTAMTWDGDHIWVTNGVDNTVSVINAETGEPVTLINENGQESEVLEVGIFPISIAFDGRHIWVAHYDGSILVYDVRTTTALDDDDDDSSDSDDGDDESDTLVVVQEGEIVIEDLEGNPQRPIQLLYAFEHVWVTNVHDGTGSITAYRAVDGEFIQTFPTSATGEFPATMTYVGDQIWVADWVSREITPLNTVNIWDGLTLNDSAIVTTTPGIWLPTATPTNTPIATATPLSCVPNVEPQLVVGGRGRVNAAIITAPYRLRPEPSSFGDPIGVYPPGSTFDVIGGFVCEDEGTDEALTFFEVRMDADGEEGWMSETFDGEYALIPIEE